MGVPSSMAFNLAALLSLPYTRAVRETSFDPEDQTALPLTPTTDQTTGNTIGLHP